MTGVAQRSARSPNAQEKAQAQIDSIVARNESSQAIRNA